jgi:hypothetical protein
MLKVLYSELIKNNPNDKYGQVIERSKQVKSLTDAVSFSRYIANTTHILGKPIIIEED